MPYAQSCVASIAQVLAQNGVALGQFSKASVGTSESPLHGCQRYTNTARNFVKTHALEVAQQPRRLKAIGKLHYYLAGPAKYFGAHWIAGGQHFMSQFVRLRPSIEPAPAPPFRVSKTNRDGYQPSP